jgi:hypothetical protein
MVSDKQVFWVTGFLCMYAVLYLREGGKAFRSHPKGIQDVSEAERDIHIIAHILLPCAALQLSSSYQTPTTYWPV